MKVVGILSSTVHEPRSRQSAWIERCRRPPLHTPHWPRPLVYTATSQKQPLLGLSVVSISPSSLGLGGAAAPPTSLCALRSLKRDTEAEGWRHRLDVTMLLHHLPSDLLAWFVLNRRTSRCLLCPNIFLPSHRPLPALLPLSLASWA
jgi:hypothetical protein